MSRSIADFTAKLTLIMIIYYIIYFFYLFDCLLKKKEC